MPRLNYLLRALPVKLLSVFFFKGSAFQFSAIRLGRQISEAPEIHFFPPQGKVGGMGFPDPVKYYKNCTLGKGG